MPKSKINICNLTTSAYLGVSIQEKALKQEVKWEIELQFSELVKGCFDDNINSTACYDKIANKINDICKLQDYNLIEHLCFKVYEAIKSQITGADIKVTVIKTPKNNNDLIYKANFTISDF
jgi:dihydroneopterin aldolase